MEDSFKKIKYDKFVFELKFLEADLHYHNSILEKASAEFDAQCREAIKKRGLEEVFYGEKSAAEQHAKQQKAQKVLEKKTKVSKQSEQLFRQIAAVTHPDKLLNLEFDEREAKKILFSEALLAKDDDNLLKLHIIASDLNLCVSEISIENLLMFENKIAQMKGEIDAKKATWMWNWLLSTPDKKDNLMNDYVKFMIQTISKKETE